MENSQSHTSESTKSKQSYKRWCERCKRYHDSPPVDVNKMIIDHAKALADEIDREVLRMLRNK